MKLMDELQDKSNAQQLDFEHIGSRPPMIQEEPAISELILFHTYSIMKENYVDMIRLPTELMK